MIQFKDLADAWEIAKPAIVRIANAGILQGDPDGSFRPRDPITRQELALIMDRLLLLEDAIEDAQRIRILKTVANSVVQVQTDRSIGSGAVVSTGAISYAVTNAHVIESAKQIQLFWPSTYADPNLPKDFVGPSATVVATDPQRDLALLQFTAQGAVPVEIDHEWATSPAELNRADFIGRRVYVVGSPLAHGGRLSEGIFNGIRQGLFDMDMHINPGNSGGPIFDRDGQMVGLVVAKLYEPDPSQADIEGFGKGIPLHTIIDFLAQHGL